jgi:hypothetical protein
MAEIIIKHNNMVILCDAEDFPVLSRFNWGWDGRYPTYTLKSKKIYFHEFVMPRSTQALCRMVVDHIDGNTLNNCKHNLRWATKAQNAQNQTNKDFIGVSYDRRRKKYRAYHTVGGVWINLGYHATEIEAAKAYNKATANRGEGFIKRNKI